MALSLNIIELGATAWRELINNNFTKIVNAINNDVAAKNGNVANDFALKNLQTNGTVDFESIETTTDTALPTNAAGFVKIKINGTIYKIPFYSIS
jgi:hypothetical protein